MSNIAWAPADARAVYALMARHQCCGLEIAPGLTFPEEADPFRPSPQAVAGLAADLRGFGLQLVSMQSLLFGQDEARLFGDTGQRTAFELAMLRAIGLAEMLGIPNLVFGSPVNRAYPPELSAAEADTRAMEVFARLGDSAVAAGTRIAIEPNPAAYHTNFLTTVAAAADFVARMDHPGITLNFDVGALLMNDEVEAIDRILTRAARHISHVHLSEPQLAPAPANTAATTRIARAMADTGYDGWFSIEMRTPAENPLAAIDASLGKAAHALVTAAERPGHAH